MPFGPYADMSDCMSKNKDKSDPAAYCAVIKKKAENEAYAKKHGLKIDEKGRIVVAESVNMTLAGTLQ